LTSTRDSVAMRTCPIAWVKGASRRRQRSSSVRASAVYLITSRLRPIENTRTPGLARSIVSASVRTPDGEASPGVRPIRK
jgi:hypothetical protein